MKHRTLSRTKLRRGFTLLELLLVLVILVVIAGFGIQAFTSTRERAKMQQAKITLGMLSTSLKQYQMEVNTVNRKWKIIAVALCRFVNSKGDLRPV